MKIRFNNNHVKGQLRDVVLTLNTKYKKAGETEFIVEDTDFSGRQLLDMAKQGVVLEEGMRTFLKTTVDFLDFEYSRVELEDGTTEIILMRDYLSQHMNYVPGDNSFLLILLAAPEHFNGEQLIEFSQYGEILNMNEYTKLKEGLELTIEEIDKEWVKYFTDYKQARERLKTLSDARANEGLELTIEEVKVLARWFVIPVSQSITLYTIEELEIYGDHFNQLSIESRKQRLAKAMKFVRFHLGMEFADDVLLDVKDLDRLYTNYGREGTMKVSYEGKVDKTGLFDYILGTDIYTETGLPSKTLPVDCAFTIQQVIDKLMSILDDGVY
jgi:uncharacterized protein YifE (UPF0438 family)